jgi:PAS domain S-box-containing protein
MKLNFIPQRHFSQLSLFVAVILTATFFSFSWITLHEHRDQLLQLMQQDAEIISHSLADGSAQHILVEDYAGLDAYLAESIVLPNITSLQVCEPSGRVVSEAFKENGVSQPQVTPPSQPVTSLQNNQTSLIVWHPLLAGSHIGWIRVDVSLETLNRQLTGLWQKALLLTLFWIVISVVLLLFLLKRPIKMIQNIADFTREMDDRKGELFDISYGPLEIRQLGEAINHTSLELQITEKALDSERQRLAVTLQSLGEGVIATDISGKITLFNTIAEVLVGYSLQEALGCHLSEIFILEGINQDLIKNVITTAKVFEVNKQAVLVSKAGKRCYITITATPIIDMQAGTIGAVLVFKDVSEQRKAEEEQRLNEARFESLFTLSQMANSNEQELTDFALDEAVRLTGSEVGYLHFYTEDEQSLRLFSWSKQTLSHCTAAKAPHYPLAEAGIWADSIRNRQPVIHNDYPGYPAKKGCPAGHFPLLRHMSIPIFADERIVAVAGVGNKQEPYDQADVRQLSLFMSNMIGIMKQKQANDRAHQAKKEWERTFDSIDDAVTIHDAEMRILMTNRAAERILAIPRQEIIGRHCYDVFRGSPQPCSGCPEISSLASQRPHSGEITHPLLSKTFLVSCSPILDDQGDVKGFVNTAKDITEQRKIESQLRQAQKMEALGALAGGIAHDFNNILSGIFGYTELSMLALNDPANLQKYLKVLLASAERARDLVKQILTFSRQRESSAESMQPKFIIKEALKLLEGSLPTTIHLQQDIQSQCYINADPTAIHQLVMNLCTNACHAMEATNGGHLAISLTDVVLDEHFAQNHSGITPGNFIRLTVSDTGQGMPPEIIAKIFDPFFTTKPEGKGTGLGLSMVHGIVHNSGGTVTVYSEIGKGSTFNAFLPAITDTEEKQAEISAALPSGTGSILFVEDEHVLLMLNKQLLEGMGYTVTAHAFPTEALADFQRDPNRFDLLISDINMPGLNGVDLARQVKGLRKDIPIILMTGYSADIVEKNIAGLGVKKLLMKPLLRKELARAVRQVLDQESGQ